MNKIWILDFFKIFIFVDMIFLGFKVGKGGLE